MKTENYDVAAVGFGNAAQAAAVLAHTVGANVLGFCAKRQGTDPR
jgi:hypothetical protein